MAADDQDTALADLFWRVAATLRRTSRDSLAQWDISPSHSRAIAVLERHGVMRLRELSDHLHIAARSTTEVVDGLEDRGLIERRPDPHDRRATLVGLTPSGIRVSRAISSAREADAERFFGVLSDTDRKQLADLLRKLGR